MMLILIRWKKPKRIRVSSFLAPQKSGSLQLSNKFPQILMNTFSRKKRISTLNKNFKVKFIKSLFQQILLTHHIFKKNNCLVLVIMNLKYKKSKSQKEMCYLAMNRDSNKTFMIFINNKKKNINLWFNQMKILWNGET